MSTTTTPTNNCPICSTPSSSHCSHCRKVVYCSKEHQKLDRKQHKPSCYPAIITTNSVLGQHLQASRDISPGEKIFKGTPLIIGPRSNFPHFQKICLGCCNKIGDDNLAYSCSRCGWLVCDEKCEKNPNHAKFECAILSAGKVSPAQCQEEYLCITFLRCVLLQEIDPVRWDQLLQFESHVNLRKVRPACVQQTRLAIHFIQDKCKMSHIDAKLIDLVCGIIIVNGYGDSSTFAVKLYSKSAKLSHACIPNTRTILDSSGLEIVATVKIERGQPLTQLYGRIFKGTHARQELLQNIYYFSCTCPRCIDPAELGTYFSGVKCPMKKCGGYLLQKKPLDISPTSNWSCDHCKHSAAFIRCVVPALAQIHKEAGTDENEGLYSEYEMYQYDNPEVPVSGNVDLVTTMKLDHVLKMLAVLGKLETRIVHPNHYALLPLKTALIATIHSLLVLPSSSSTAILTQDIIKNLLDEYLRMVKGILQVVDILLPGMTSERGLLLFYLAEGLRFSLIQSNQGKQIQVQELTKLQEEALKIMMLDDEDDDHRKLVVKYLGNK